MEGLELGNFAGYAIAFVLGFLLGKKIAKMGFFFMVFLAVAIYFIYQTYAGGGAPAK